MKKIIAKGMDVSYSQGKINWNKVKASGMIDFAIIRAGYGKELSQIDSQFENNYKGCKDNGISVGAYWYSYAKTPEDAKKEAQTCLKILSGKQFEYPVAFDIEESDILNNRDVNGICEAFCSEIEKGGYFAAIYSFKSAFEYQINSTIKNKYSTFLSHVDVQETNYQGAFDIWQYSWKGVVPGITGDVDLDYSYKDFPTAIKNSGMNGFKANSGSNSNVIPNKNSIHEFAPADNIQIFPHFNCNEFKCKCGDEHSYYIDFDLLKGLESLRDQLNCNSIVITSGYRCSAHDKNVGGTGSGFHTKGQAADIICYDTNRNVISAKEVCCAAQDLGFMGIANIDKDYTVTHLDMGNRKWYGDEFTGENNISDFHSYFQQSNSKVEDDNQNVLKDILSHVAAIDSKLK